MKSFYKKPAYFFKYIRINNRIRFIRNKYRGGRLYQLLKSKDYCTIFSIQQYFKTKGCLSYNEETGYFRYKKDDLILSTDNYDTSNFNNVFENITFILNKSLSAVIKFKEFAYKTKKNDDINYKIGCIKDTNYKYKIIKPILYKTKNNDFYDDDYDDKLDILVDNNLNGPETIGHIFYLSYKKIENIVFFLTYTDILDILDYYYNDYNDYHDD